MAKLNKLGVKNSLWNNIRAKKGSGKAPTKDMLKQEAKIKKEEKMKNMYKKGGKSSKPKMKESWMEESKEVHFGSKPKLKMMGGKKDLYKKGGFPDLNKDGKTTFADVLEGRGVNKKKAGGEKSMEPGGGGRFAKMVAGLKKKGKSEESAKAIAASAGRKKYGKSRFQEMAAAGKKSKYKEGGANAVPECGANQFWNGTKCVSTKDSSLPEPDIFEKYVNEVLPSYDKKTGKREFIYKEGLFDEKGRGVTVDYDELQRQRKAREKKKTGGKKEEGGFEDEEMEMEMEMESTESSMKPKKRKKVNASAAARKRGNAARKNQRRGRTGCYSGNCAESIPEV